MGTAVVQVFCQVCSAPRRQTKHNTCNTCYFCGYNWINCSCDDEVYEAQFGQNGDPHFFDAAPPKGESMPINTPNTTPPALSPNEFVSLVKNELVSLVKTEHALNVKECPFQCRSHYEPGFIDQASTYHSWASTGTVRIGLFEGSPSQVPAASSTNKGKPLGGSYISCTHAWQSIKVGDGKLRVTAHHDVNKCLDKTPDLGIYLDRVWYHVVTKEPEMAMPLEPFDVPGLILGGGAEQVKELDFSTLREEAKAEQALYDAAKKAANENRTFIFPTIIVDWKDGSAIHLQALKRLSGIVQATIQKNMVVETGCIGAHGRTGVFLSALLMDAEGLDPKTAISETRKRLCKKCVETQTQVRAIFAYGGQTPKEKEVKDLANRAY